MSWLSDLTGVNIDVGRTSVRDAFNVGKHFEDFKKNIPRAGDTLSKNISDTVGSNFITGRSREKERSDNAQAANQEAEAAAQKSESDRILAAQQKTAADFASAAPGLKESTFGGLAGQERRRLAGEMAGIRGGASSRGLLYSGIRQGQEAKARGESEANLAGQKQGINTAIDEQAQKLKEAPMRSGLSLAEMQNNIANQAMSQAISNMQQRQEGYAQVGSAIGSAAGSYMARSKK